MVEYNQIFLLNLWQLIFLQILLISALIACWIFRAIKISWMTNKMHNRTPSTNLGKDLSTFSNSNDGNKNNLWEKIRAFIKEHWKTLIWVIAITFSGVGFSYYWNEILSFFGMSYTQRVMWGEVFILFREIFFPSDVESVKNFKEIRSILDEAANYKVNLLYQDRVPHVLSHYPMINYNNTHSSFYFPIGTFQNLYSQKNWLILSITDSRLLNSEWDYWSSYEGNLRRPSLYCPYNPGFSYFPQQKNYAWVTAYLVIIEYEMLKFIGEARFLEITDWTQFASYDKFSYLQDVHNSIMSGKTPAHRQKILIEEYLREPVKFMDFTEKLESRGNLSLFRRELLQWIWNNHYQLSEVYNYIPKLNNDCWPSFKMEAIFNHEETPAPNNTQITQY